MTETCWPDYPAFSAACEEERAASLNPTALQAWLDKADVAETYRLAVHLRVVEHATYDEISELLELRPGQVKWRILSTREKVRRYLAGMPEGEWLGDREWLKELLDAFKNSREGPQHVAEHPHPRLVNADDLMGRPWRTEEAVRASERGW